MIPFIILLTLISTTLSQDEGMQPDVRFGEENDRFDVDNIVQMQNRLYHQQLDDMDDGDDEMERRNNAKGEAAKRRHHHGMKRLPDAELGARRSWYSLYNSRDDDFERSGRRAMRRDASQLLKYAVPIDVKIKGYLRAPLETN